MPSCSKLMSPLRIVGVFRKYSLGVVDLILVSSSSSISQDLILMSSFASYCSPLISQKIKLSDLKASMKFLVNKDFDSSITSDEVCGAYGSC